MVYLEGRKGFSLAFSTAAASLMGVVRQAITRKSLERKQKPHLMIQWMTGLSRTWHIYWDSVSWFR